METVVGTIDLTPTRQGTENIRRALLEGMQERDRMLERINSGAFDDLLQRAGVDDGLIFRIIEGWRESEQRSRTALLEGVNECNRALGLEPL